MQFDVFLNPLPQFRRVMPFVTVIQSDIAETGNDRIIAFLVLQSELSGQPKRLMPLVEFDGIPCAVALPTLTNVPKSMLQKPLGSIAEVREQIVNGLDFVFLGI
jgi:hypothetical protein